MLLQVQALQFSPTDRKTLFLEAKPESTPTNWAVFVFHGIVEGKRKTTMVRDHRTEMSQTTHEDGCEDHGMERFGPSV